VKVCGTVWQPKSELDKGVEKWKAEFMSKCFGKITSASVVKAMPDAGNVDAVI
jgi:hypothetical protein